MKKAAVPKEQRPLNVPMSGATASTLLPNA